MSGVSLSLDPGALTVLVLVGVLYARATIVLGRRGYFVPVGQRVAWWAGLALVALGLLSPLDGLGEELLSAHMGQHLLIADIAAPLLLLGIRSPVYAFLLPRPVLVPLARARRLRALARRLREPLVAIPVWVLILYCWHFSFAFEAAIESPLIHALQHQSFVLGSVLVWWSVIEPKRRRLPGELWKIPYVIGARLAGMFLGMAFVLLRSPAYPDPYAVTAPSHGLTAITDQQVAGGMMLGLDLFVMLFVLAFFFHRSGSDHDRAERGSATVAG
jgi:putative copper resistance protein D